MEKKSIGSFIAALRKAKGLTQRELAEKLNVSDKAVSRWEREESLPDLSLIPAIAEIFGVTADELLRGERMKEGESLPRAEEKSEKQLKNLVSRSVLRFSNRSIIAAGIALAGFIGAMIANIGFNRAYIAFFIALAFYLAAALCETGFIVAAMSALNVEEDCAAVQSARHTIVNRALWVFSLVIVLFAATLPLVILPYGNYMGLSGDSWLQYGAFLGFFGLLVSMLIARISVSVALKRGLFSLDAKQSARRRLRVISVLATLGVMGLTLVANVLLTANTIMYADAIVFDNYEDFVDFMAEENTVEYANGYAEPPSSVTYYDEHGNAISRKEAAKREIVNGEGETVLVYYQYNEQALSVSYPVSDTCLPISVVTQDAMNEALATVHMIETIFIALYIAELVAAIVIYIIKSRRIEKRPS